MSNDTSVECKENYFRCANRVYCVHNTWLCDGDTDCPDGSDESVQVCGTKQECRSDQVDYNHFGKTFEFFIETLFFSSVATMETVFLDTYNVLVLRNAKMAQMKENAVSL